MQSPAPRYPERKSAARRDMAVILAVGAAWAFICVKLDVSEALLGWTRQHENLQLDEMPGILLVVAVCLVWFSVRRFFEATREIDLRRAAEARLADALEENQRLAQQYLDMQEYERKSLARDLHDELGQYINAIKLDAVAIRDSIPDAQLSTRNRAGAMIGNIDRVYEVVGGLIRQLRPVGFDDLGVAAALEHCVNDWRRRLAADVELAIDCDLTVLDAMRSLALFRLVQEAMTNIARHARAARIRIRIAARRGSDGAQLIETSIADDGCGIDLAAPRRGLGLVGMRERAAACGGAVVLSSEPGGGFKVTATLPIADASGAGVPQATP